MVLEKTLESPLDWKNKPVRPKGNQSWIFIGRTDVEAETPILWPPDAKNWLTGKGPDLGKDWKQEEKGNDREWEGWMTSPTQWTWVWASPGSWWWTSVLQSMELQRVRHDWMTELNWTNHVNPLWHTLQIFKNFVLNTRIKNCKHLQSFLMQLTSYISNWYDTREMV